MSDEKEFYDLIAWIDKKRIVIGYAYMTNAGSIRLKAHDHLDTSKLGRAIVEGLEIRKKHHAYKNKN